MFACSHKVVQLILLHNSFQEPGKSYLFFVYLSIFLCMNVYPHLCIVYLKFDTICSDINMNNVVRTSTHHFLKICISKVCCIFKSNSQLKTKCVQCSGTAFSLTLSVETKNEDLLLQMLIYIHTNIHLYIYTYGGKSVFTSKKVVYVRLFLLNVMIIYYLPLNIQFIESSFWFDQSPSLRCGG